MKKDRPQTTKGELGVALVEAFRPWGKHDDLVVVSLRGQGKHAPEVLEYPAFQRKYKSDLDPGSAQILKLETQAYRPAAKVNRSLESLIPAKPVTEETANAQKNTKPAWKWDSEKVIRMAKDMTEEEISTKLGIKRGSVATILRRAGVKAVSRSDRIIERDRSLLAPLAAKMDTARIAKHLKKPYNCIRVRLIRCGIKALPGNKGKPMKIRGKK